MSCKVRSPLYNAYLFYKLSELDKCFKAYITLSSSVTNSCDYNQYIQKQLEIIDLLKQIIEEINISKIIPSYLLQLKIQRVHNGWTGRTTKTFFG